jgi:STE24 endopeptidase
MYLLVIGISALVLTLNGPLYGLISGPGALAAALAATTLLPAVVALCVMRQVLRLLDADPAHPARGQAAHARGMGIIQGLLAVGQGGVMLVTDWLAWCDRLPVVGTWPAISGIVALLPLLASILLVWTALYPADRAVRQIAVELYLLRGKPLRPVWRFVQYLLYNLRHQVLFVLVPMLLILAASDVIGHYSAVVRRATGQMYAPDVLVGVAAIVVAVITPEILRHVWITQRLPDGALRDRLLLLAGKLRLRFREILIWRSGGMIVNAAVMGVVAPLRYVLITDGMLEQMDDAKIEAVFGHEAGHVKRHHILFFLLFAFTSGCLATIFTLHTHATAGGLLDTQQLLVARLGAVLVFKWGFVFGWISRRFERQADIYGVRTLALSGLPCLQPCAVHAPVENPGPAAERDGLCATAAHVFGDALNEVALLNGIRPEARSWRHSSISSRSRFLQQLAQEPRQVRRFERGVLLSKLGILIAAAVTGIWAAYDLKMLDVILRALS